MFVLKVQWVNCFLVLKVSLFRVSEAKSFLRSLADQSWEKGFQHSDPSQVFFSLCLARLLFQETQYFDYSDWLMVSPPTPPSFLESRKLLDYSLFYRQKPLIDLLVL